MPAEAEVRVYTAKKILTMEPSLPVATAVAIEGDRIVAVGDMESMKDWLETLPHRVDERFADKVLLPGLIDNHLHPIMAGILLPMEFVTPFDWDLPGREVVGVRGHDAYLSRVREILAEQEESEEPLFVWGYHPIFHGPLSRSDLDEISDSRPIIAWHRSFHEIYTNTPGLEWLGITQQRASEYENIDFETGHLWESGLGPAFQTLGPILLAPDRIASGLEQMRKVVHRGGITTIADMATGLFDIETEWQAMSRVLEQPETPFRTYLVPDGRQLRETLGSQGAFNLIQELRARNSRRLRFLRAVKFYADGAFFSQLMQLGPPGYMDGHEGEWLMEPDDLLQAVQPYWNNGYQLHVHANGDEGVRVTLNVLNEILDIHPRFDHRFTLHHLGYSTVAQARRAKALGALVSANPFYLFALGDAYARVGLGPERASQLVRLGALVREGVPVSLHSDFTMAPAEPLRLVEIAVTRKSESGKVLAPEERLTVEQALRAVTIDAAYALEVDDMIGSIAAGKKADFTILDADPTAVSPDEIGSIDVWGTIFEGQVFPLAPKPRKTDMP